MKKVIFVAAVFAVPFLLAAALLSPPHYFVVNTRGQATSASLAVGNGAARPATVIAGFVFAQTNIVESSAVLEITFTNGSKQKCQFGYFTSFQAQPHYLSIEECDKRWH